MMNAKPKPPVKKLPAKKPTVPWSKNFLPQQGPQINGSDLQYTSASSRNFKMPEARA